MQNNQLIYETAVKAIDSKRGEDIEVIKVDDITVLTDYFVIATANSNTQLKAIADEGERTDWVCLDYLGVVIHILLKDRRGFYQIERLWEDGEKVNIDNLVIKE